MFFIYYFIFPMKRLVELKKTLISLPADKSVFKYIVIITAANLGNRETNSDAKTTISLQ